MIEVTSTSLAESAPPFTRHERGAVVAVIDGSDVDRQVAIGERAVVVGSGRDVDLVLEDPTVSRRHLRIEAVDGGVEVTDLDSKNGCFAGAVRIYRARLEPGAVLRVGHTALKILPREAAIDPEPSPGTGLGALRGESRAMRQLFALIEQVAGAGISVLIEGETGVGKELVAEELHRLSGRSGELVVFDCGAVPRELVESTLFGHKRGAFTGATADQKGLFDEADGGTLFLDEIGELEPGLQPALLRALDRGAVRPVGATGYHGVDVRVIAATHRNLGDRIGAGEFREDLYYRLAVVRLTVPPLRERLEDIGLLVDHFLAAIGRSDLEVSEQALETLRGHSWPGNVRELRNAVERGAALSRDNALAIELSGPSGSGTAPASVAAAAPKSAPRRPFRDAKADAIARFERDYLESLMAGHQTLTEAAHAAGMDRKHLRTLLKRHGIG